MKFPRTKKLVFCNNKGGVGKTTLAFNCAAAFADKGYKTVLVDLDPQCNSTILCLGQDFYAKDLFASQNVYTAISGVFEGGSDIDLKTPFIPSRTIKNLFVFPGSLKLSTLEDALGAAFSQAAAGNKLGYFMTSALFRLLTEKGMQEQVDIFVIDTSPSLGLLTRAIILGADYFVVPMNPDGFSVQGIENLGTTIEKWRKDWKITARAVAGDTPLKNVLPGEPTFIGYIVNSYNVYAQKPIKDHRNWMEEIPGKVREFLARRHSRNGLVEQSWPEPLAITQDYGRLASYSQENCRAIFHNSPEEVPPGTQDNISKSKKEFDELSDKLLSVLAAY